MPNNQSLGKNLLHLRKQAKLRREKVAEAAGISPKTLSKVESGEYNTTILTVAKVAKALGYFLEFKLRKEMPVEIDNGTMKQKEEN